MLVLFDCDGTLFLGEDRLTQPAMLDALSELTGTRLTKEAMDELDHEARCARWLARELVREHDLGDVDFDEWVRLTERIYHERLDGDAPREWRTPAGTREALEQLHRLRFRPAVLTGLPKGIARTRLEQAGIARFFPHDEGAFGSEACERDELLELALERAGVDESHAVAVGDTSRDVLSARRNGLEVIAVQFEGEPPRNADHAYAVVESMPELVRTLQQLRHRRLLQVA